MPIALCALSHSPLMGRNNPSHTVIDEVEAALADARAFIAAFDPEVVVIFAPDHYNGVFYDLLPPFCIGRAARSIGDYDTQAAALDVDVDAANRIISTVLEAGVDVALSDRMVVDHGFAQPLELLLGSVDAKPTVPIFINSVSEPLGPLRRVRMLGEAVGQALAGIEKRVLLIGSGGLSHDPPVPRFDTAAPEVRNGLIDGRNPTPAERSAREQRVIDAGRAFAAGSTALQPLNPQWDQLVLDVLASGNLERVDQWSVDWFVEQGGHSSHETRAWIASYAALAACGPYTVRSRYYRPIPEWIAGFAVTTAIQTPTRGDLT